MFSWNTECILVSQTNSSSQRILNSIFMSRFVSIKSLLVIIIFLFACRQMPAHSLVSLILSP